MSAYDLEVGRSGDGDVTHEGMPAPRTAAGVRFAVLGNVIVSTRSGPLQAEHLSTFDALMDEARARHPEGVVLFVSLEPGANVHEESYQRESQAAYGRWASAIRAVAQLVEGGNLWAATARSMMIALRLPMR